MLYLIPGENLIHRKAVAILHDSLLGSALFLVYKIADQKIHRLWSSCKIFQCLKNFFIGFPMYPVITVHNFKVKTAGIAQPGVYRLTVSAVFLMNGFYDRGIFFRIIIGDLRRSV